MLIFDAAEAAADIASRWGTDWLDRHPLHLLEDTDSVLHTRAHCRHQNGPAAAADVALHHLDGRRWCRYCPASAGILIEDWVTCVRAAEQLDAQLAAKHTCFDALDVGLAAARLADAIAAYRLDDPTLHAHVARSRTEAEVRLARATGQHRASTLRAAATVTDTRCGDGTGPAVVLVEWTPSRAPTMAAAWPHTFDADRLVAAVPDVVAHGIVACVGDWAVAGMFGGAHIEHLERPATAAQLELALGLWGSDVEDPADAWAATAALTA